MKKFDERRRFIINYLRARDKDSWVDVLNSDFVDAYIDLNKSGLRVRFVNFGAHRVPMLGNDLSRMCREGALTRQRTSINGLRGQGFPTWVYTYKLAAYVL